ncbi:MAG: hypothetical protein L6V93_17910 [Clostridiales bacterium]|nr:MAG: hypothetical protein L6V93_17910 [Clostridiales bacterium]
MNLRIAPAPSSSAASYSSSGTFESAAIKYKTFIPKVDQIPAVTSTESEVNVSEKPRNLLFNNSEF